ncbi:MAG TPA: potassium channel family protein [Bacillaceae bacterium]
MWYFFFFSVILCIIMALRILFFPARFKYKEVSFENFVFLGFTYAVIMLGFSLLFLLFEIKGYHVIMDSGEFMPQNLFGRLGTCLYLSAITLFSVGYGDVVPVGPGRVLVIIEALIGYTIPAAFVVRTFIDYDPLHKQRS